jgi:hypothetical protein
VHDGVALVDDQAGAVGLLVGRPFRFARRPHGLRLRREVNPPGPDSLGDRLGGLLHPGLCCVAPPALFIASSPIS